MSKECKVKDCRKCKTPPAENYLPSLGHTYGCVNCEEEFFLGRTKEEAAANWNFAQSEPKIHHQLLLVGAILIVVLWTITRGLS